MNRFFTIATVALIALASCKGAPKADKAETTEEQQALSKEGVAYHIDSTQVVSFIGSKPVGEHHGTFNISEGQLFVSNGVSVTGGKLTMDLKSLKITDKDTAGSTKLAGHLASADFFEVDKFPTATFEITDVQPYNADSTKSALVLDGATHTISGNLTLRGVTKNVTFPAIIKVTDNVATAQANFNINRTDWGLVYGNDKSLGDKFIRPEVNVSFSIAANKQQ